MPHEWVAKCPLGLVELTGSSPYLEQARSPTLHRRLNRIRMNRCPSELPLKAQSWTNAQKWNCQNRELSHASGNQLRSGYGLLSLTKEMERNPLIPFSVRETQLRHIPCCATQSAFAGSRQFHRETISPHFPSYALDLSSPSVAP